MERIETDILIAGGGVAGLGAAAYILTRPPRAVQGADDNDEE